MDKKQFLTKDELLTHLIGCFAESVFSAYSDDGRVYAKAQEFYKQELAAQDTFTNRDVWVATATRYPDHIRMPNEKDE